MLIHGINGSSSEWNDLTRALPVGHHVLTVELPGHEATLPSVRPVTMDGCLDAAIAVLNETDTRPAHVVGSSFGGAVGLALAAEHPDLVASVTTLGTSLGADASRFAAVASALRATGPRAFFTEVIPRFSYPPHTPPEVVRAAVDRAARHDIETVIDILRLGFCTDLWSYAERIAAPLLIAGGTADLTCPPTDVRALAEAFSATPTILDGLGHLPHIEDPDRTAALLQRFWAATPSTPARRHASGDSRPVAPTANQVSTSPVRGATRNDPIVTIQDAAKQIAAQMTLWRRAVHRHPEMGLVLPKTQNTVLAALAPLGLDLRTGAGLSSVVATLHGTRPGPLTLLRADMDALPVDEPPDAPHCSQVTGVMHACGHDAHTAMLLGAAHVLASMRDRITGSVRFVFQPGEEGHGGAELLVSEHVLDGVDLAFAAHVAPQLPTGLIASRLGPIMASSDTFEVTLSGYGGHGSTSTGAGNTAVIAARMASAIPNLINSHTDSDGGADVSICMIHSGRAANVAPVAAQIAGTLRAFSTAAREAARCHIEKGVARIAAQHQVSATVDWIGPYAPLMTNHEHAYRYLEQAVQHTAARRLTPVPVPIPASEDFAVIAERVPAAIAFIGARSPHGDSGAVHAPTLRIDEDCLPIGAALYAALAMGHAA